jgi:putative redox protein
MAVVITGEYTGGLRMTLRHGPSHAELRTAAPVDNMGDGSSFSPTDLLAAALGACMVTTMAIVARREGIAFEGASFRVEKHMVADPLRRVGRLPIVIRMPPGLGDADRLLLERTARTCPVERSLSEGVERDIRFVYEEAAP